MDKKAFAVLVALMMASVAGIAIINIDSVDASPVDGAFDIYMSESLPDDEGKVAWGTATAASGYNAYLAVKNYCSSVNKTVSGEETYTTTKTNSWGSYTAIDSEYGTILNIDNKDFADGNSWHTFVYVNGSWTESIVGLGHYKAFADYDSTLRSSNVALYYGTDTNASLAKASLPTTDLKGYVPITTDANSPFAVYFTIKIVSTNYTGNITGGYTEEQLTQGITITGYGSDAALAFKNAFNSKTENAATIMNDKAYDEYFRDSDYGFVSKILGVSGNSEDLDEDGYADIFYYWSMGIGANNAYAEFMPGFYTPLNEAVSIGSGFIQNTFSFTFIES